MVRIGPLIAGTRKEGGITIPAASDVERRAATEEAETVEPRNAASRRLGRGATEGGKRTIAEQGDKTRPINKREGRSFGEMLCLGECSTPGS